jgi:hypothetical protein
VERARPFVISPPDPIAVVTEDGSIANIYQAEAAWELAVIEVMLPPVSAKRV